jgi:hypothetical protein
MKKVQTVVFWALVFMVLYLYAYETCITTTSIPTPRAIPEHSYEQRRVPEAWDWVAGKLNHVLWFLSIPTVPGSQRFLAQEPYYSELIYIPFINAFQWFGYGALFGLWRCRRDTGKRNRTAAG